MFKAGRWRGQRNKMKALFKLQFHATQVSEIGFDELVVSVVPRDSGKPTLRSEKSAIRDGFCRWEKPVYETVTLSRELKTGKIGQKVYHFVVSTGSATGSSVGEVSVDLADYSEAVKPALVSLPLGNSGSNNGVLHVSIQRIQEDSVQRQTEDLEETNSKIDDGGIIKPRQSNADRDESVRSRSTEDERLVKTALNAKSYGNGRASSGSDITISTSESSSGFNTPCDVGTRHGNIEHDPASFLSLMSYASVPRKPMAGPHSGPYEDTGRPQWEWSFDHKSKTGSSAYDTEIDRLKAELTTTARKVDLSELELQTLRRQIVKERKKGQELLREFTALREEKDAIEEECQSLKSLKTRVEDGDMEVILEEVRQELSYEKDMNTNLRMQLDKTQESNAELILAVKDLDEMLEKKKMEISGLYDRLNCSQNAQCDSDEDDDGQKALEELVKEHKDAKDTSMQDQKLAEVCSQLEICQREKEELETQMEQIALEYEILKQENHDILCKLEQSELKEQLKFQYDISLIESDIEKGYGELEMRVKSLEEEMEDQAQEFVAALAEITHAKVEQEKRAIQAEESLMKLRMKNGITAERLQEEFGKLAMQMDVVFNANEKAAKRAVAEASELRKENSMLHEEIQKVRDSYEAKIVELSLQIEEKRNQVERSENLWNETSSLKAEIKMLIEQNNQLANELKGKEELHSELENLKLKCDDLRQSALGRELEKPKLRKEVFQLKGEPNRKEDVATRSEKKNNTRVELSDSTRNPLRNNRSITPSPSPRGSKEVATLKEKIKLLEGQLRLKEAKLKASANSFDEKERDMLNRIEGLQRILEEHNQRNGKKTSGGTPNVADLLTESGLLRQKNELMEIELKDLQERYSEMSLKFAEVEGERQQLVITLRNLKHAKA